MKKQALETIAEMYAYPMFHFHVETIGEKEELYIRGYIAAISELRIVEFEELEEFLKSIKRNK